MVALSSPVLCSIRTTPSIKERKKSNSRSEELNNKSDGAVKNIVQVVQKDVEYLKTGLTKGLQWANKAFRIPEVSKSVEDLLWFRNIEDPQASFLQLPSFPQPCYPELSGVDLFMADVKALEVYIAYYYHLSKMWTKPLPETYDPQEAADYFTLRPHLVALRLIEVFTAFASTTIKYRISRASTGADEDARKNISDYNFGVVLKDTMLNLGPTFIKVGQSLSTRPDIIGSEVAKALSELQDQIPPFPRTEAMKIIEEELGSPAERFFSYVSEEPVAAASFGQVYKARTHDGFDVAVKVQRPNLRHFVVRDAYLLRIGLGLLQRIAKRKSDLRLYADELGKGLIGELDYTLEAANAFEFQEAHSQFTFIVLPKIFRELSKKRILTMEWMVGDRPVDLVSASSQESKKKLLDMVNKGVEASLIQLLETGIMHADPHPGNLRYLPSGRLGLLDFGLLCRMEKKHRLAMLASIVHIVNGDWGSLVYDLNEMDVIRPGTNIRRFTMDLEDSLGELEFKNGMPDVKFSRILGQIWSVALKYHCRMPPYYVLVLRSLASLEGLAVAADPEFKTFEAAYPYVVQKLLVDNSAATRRILHSVVFNRRREFQWQRLAVFLRVGATRRGLHTLMSSNTPTSLVPSGAAPEVNLANLALRLLPSRNGLVLRRLLMTADGASLVKALISKEAYFFRKQVCMFIADVLYQWMSEAVQQGLNLFKFSSSVTVATGGNSTQVSSAKTEYESILGDRRLKVIFLNVLNSARKKPILMLRFCWTSFVLLFVASALACNRVLISLSGAFMDRVSYHSKQVAMNT